MTEFTEFMIIVLEIINDSRVHRIHDNCFRDNQQITEILIPTHITTLGQFSFSNCQQLTKVIIPSSVTTIPYCCFEHCYNLKELQLPNPIQLETNCFWQCHSSPMNPKYHFLQQRSFIEKHVLNKK